MEVLILPTGKEVLTIVADIQKILCQDELMNLQNN